MPISSFAVFLGRPFVKRFALCYQTVVYPVCPVCDVGVLWPNGWMDQDETWHAGRPRPWPHCFRWGPSSPSPKGAQPPSNFQPISVVAKWLDGLKMSLGREVGLGPSNIVLDGDTAPLPKRGRAPNCEPYLLWPNDGWMDQDATC